MFVRVDITSTPDDAADWNGGGVPVRRHSILLATLTAHMLLLALLSHQRTDSLKPAPTRLILMSLSNPGPPAEKPAERKEPTTPPKPTHPAADPPAPASEWSRSSMRVTVTDPVPSASAQVVTAAPPATSSPQMFGPDPYAGAAMLSPSEIAALAGGSAATVPTFADKRLDTASLTTVLTWFSKVAPDAHGSVSFVLTIGAGGKIRSVSIKAGTMPQPRAELLGQMMISVLKLSAAAPRSGRFTVGPVTFG